MTPNSKLRIKPKEEQKTKSSSKGFSLKHRAKPTCGKQASKKKHYGFRNVLVHTEYKDEGSLLRQVHGFGVFLALLCYHSVKKKPAQTQNHPQTNPPPPNLPQYKTTPANQPNSLPPSSTFFGHTNRKPDFNLWATQNLTETVFLFFSSHTRNQWIGAHPLDNRA